MPKINYTTEEIQAILDEAKKVSDFAEENLDTLIEIANALGNDPNFAANINTQFDEINALINGIIDGSTPIS